MTHTEKRKLVASKSSVVRFSDVRETLGYELTGIRCEIDVVGVQMKVRLEELPLLRSTMRKIQKEIQRIEDLRERGILQFDRTQLRKLLTEEATLAIHSEKLDREFRQLCREQMKMKKEDAPRALKRLLHTERIAARVVRMQ